MIDWLVRIFFWRRLRREAEFQRLVDCEIAAAQERARIEGPLALSEDAWRLAVAKWDCREQADNQREMDRMKGQR